MKEQDSRYADSVPSERKDLLLQHERYAFYESMPTEPEVVLADLLHIFHPDLLPIIHLFIMHGSNKLHE